MSHKKQLLTGATRSLELANTVHVTIHKRPSILSSKNCSIPRVMLVMFVYLISLISFWTSHNTGLIAQPLAHNVTPTVESITHLTYKPTVIRSCPNLTDIPNLINNRTLNLNETRMDLTEKNIFGKQHDKVQQSVNESITKMQTRLQLNSLERQYLENMSPFGEIVGNYHWLPGGFWKPDTCVPRWKVAIIIPFRDRDFHLPILLRYLIPMLQKQLLQFAFFVINQGNSERFNRAMLMNVGFIESLKFVNWDCFILHDVDHVPMSEFNDYGCDNMPRRLITGSDLTNYKLSYPNLFGGVTGMTKEHVQRINGFPNMYWGWGGEDDDIFLRVKSMKIPVHRMKGSVGFYKVIRHHHHSAPRETKRFALLKGTVKDFKKDGLNNLKYKLQHIGLHALYTNISVHIAKVNLV